MDIIDMKFVTKQMVEDLLARADFKVRDKFELEYVKNKTRSALTPEQKEVNVISALVSHNPT